jgi:hypothetical protein
VVVFKVIKIPWIEEGNADADYECFDPKPYSFRICCD